MFTITTLTHIEKGLNTMSVHSQEMFNISPIDGRYQTAVHDLREHLSEYGLIKARTQVEIKWLIFILKSPLIPDTPQLTEQQEEKLLQIYNSFDIKAAEDIKIWEKKCNHDVKSVEYYIKDRLQAYGQFENIMPFVHFALTSEDVNNLALSLIHI